jgi:hypothetical protein
MWFLMLWAVGLVTGAIQLVASGQLITVETVSRTLLQHQFVVTFGLCGIIGVFSNIVYAERLSKKLGWPGGPYQLKYGFSQLSLGVLGVMTMMYQDHFWIAALISMYIYGLSGLWTHTKEMIDHKHFDRSNASNIVMDVVYQSFLTILSLYARIW